MNRPKWVIVTGICMIFIGLIAVVGNIFVINSVTTDNWQTKLSERYEKQYEHMTEESEREFYQIPDWFQTFAIIVGSIGLLLHLLYIYAGIALIQLKHFSIKFTYWVMGVAITMVFLKFLVSMQAPNFLTISISFSSVFGFVIDIVILIVIIFNDRSHFERADIRAINAID